MEEDFLEETRGRQIDLIVCSDAEQILGIGDQGVGVSVFDKPHISVESANQTSDCPVHIEHRCAASSRL